jgi:DNA-binding response OmpR family regulator
MSAKILVVEDELELSEAYEIILSNAGYTVLIASDGADALKILKTFEPDIILLDLRMPRVSGIEFLQKYNVREAHPHVRIIVFSNLDSQKEIDKAYELGADRYILKAWASPKELLKLVQDTLEDTKK